jgi:hypothetical protein
MAVFWVVAPCSLVEVYQLPPDYTVSTRLHGTTTQNTAIFVLTAVRTSNPTNFLWFCLHIKYCTLSQWLLNSTVTARLKYQGINGD